MNGKDLFLGMNYVNAKYVDEAETVMQLKGEHKTIVIEEISSISMGIGQCHV